MGLFAMCTQSPGTNKQHCRVLSLYGYIQLASTLGYMPIATLAEWGYAQRSETVPETASSRFRTRPWLPFAVRDIRLFGNNKSNIGPRGKDYGRRNITELGINLDTVRGCSLAAIHGFRGCYGNCYLAESMARYHMKYWIPVSMRLNSSLLVRDLESIKSDYVRNGVNGEPSFDWELTASVAELCETCDKTTVLLTRFGVEPSTQILERLARVECVIHGSVSAIDPQKHRDRVLDNLERYEVCWRSLSQKGHYSSGSTSRSPHSGMLKTTSCPWTELSSSLSGFEARALSTTCLTYHATPRRSLTQMIASPIGGRVLVTSGTVVVDVTLTVTSALTSA